MQKNSTILTAMDYVNKLLLPLEWMYYHQYNHSLEVMDRAMYLWKQEWLWESDIELLALAWLFHDTGFVIQYDSNETIGAKIAQNYLKSILYPESRIKTVYRLIKATDPDYKTPIDILEKIIKDADLDNLWRADFFEKNDNIRQEIETIKKIKVIEPNWVHASLKLIKEYEFYTPTQKKERWFMQDKNQKQLEELAVQLQEDE